MKKYLYLLPLLLTGSLKASQALSTSEATRSLSCEPISLKELSEAQANYYSTQEHIVQRHLNPIRNRSISPTAMAIKEAALKQFLLANRHMILNNAKQAVKLLLVSSAESDMSKIVLAYCFRYGIGTDINRAASNLLIDLAAHGSEDERLDIMLHIEYLLMRVQLGL